MHDVLHMLLVSSKFFSLNEVSVSVQSVPYATEILSVPSFSYLEIGLHG